MKKIVVMGATGFVGWHVCEKLARQGWHITAPVRRLSDAKGILHLPTLTVMGADVHDAQALARVVEGHEAVVNLVGILHGSLADFEQVHVALPKKIAHVCASAGVQHIVHISALGADALQPDKLPSLYLRTKGEGEAVLMQAAVGACADRAGRAGFDLTILRPSVVFGDGDQFLSLLARLQGFLPVLPLACAEARFQPVWVEDLATAVVRSLDCNACVTGIAGQSGGSALESALESALPSPRVIEAVGPDVFTLRQLAQAAARMSGMADGRPVMGLPDWAGRLQAMLMGLWPGVPMMSIDNINSMKVASIATGHLPTLSALGIRPTGVQAIARGFLQP